MNRFLIVLACLPLYLVVNGCDQADSSPNTAILPDNSVYTGEFRNGKFHGTGELKWATGARYMGEFKNGLFEGHGRIEYDSNEYYEGEFAKGMMHGEGTFVYPNGNRYEGGFSRDQIDGDGALYLKSGDSYTGHFVKGEMHGTGVYRYKNGDQYSGLFSHDSFTGDGSHTGVKGYSYTGEFKDWEYNGRGVFVTGEGEVYTGNFIDGALKGKGSHKKANGDYYEGIFDEWLYHGKGELTLKSGDKYEGNFEYGFRHGQGTLSVVNTKKRLSGNWEYGEYVPDKLAQRRRTQENVESVLYNQNDLLAKQLDQLESHRPGLIDLYFVGVGGYSKQDVFIKEIRTVRDIFDADFGTSQRSMLLANNDKEASLFPLATKTSIRRALNSVAAKIDPNEDIVFLYLTSHGSKDHRLALTMDGLSLSDINSNDLSDILDSTQIKWRVLIISACYSGGFIDQLKNQNTLIITASAKDKRSFGCSDENELTDFARAYFTEALPKASGFQEAYKIANQIILKEEAERKEKEPSDPQISAGEAISDHLTRWHSQNRLVKDTQHSTLHLRIADEQKL